MSVEQPASFDAYWSAVASGDGPGAVAVALAMREGGAPVEAVLTTLVAAGQERVGRLWLADEWNVAQEHRATSVGEEVVAALVSGLPAPAPDARAALVLCADGEWHSLPSRIVAAALRGAGWRVTFLGASVPARHVTAVLHDVGPDVVALSCSLPLRLPHARQLIETVRDAGIPVVVGGRGFGPGGRWATTLGATAWAPDAGSALSLLASAEFPRFADPAPPVPAPDAAAAEVLALRSGVPDEALRRLRAVRGDVAAYDAAQGERTREDFGYILEFLAAALFVDDVTLFTDFVGWLDELLTARGVPTPALVAGLRVLAEVLGGTLDDGAAPRARAMLASGIAAVSARDGVSAGSSVATGPSGSVGSTSVA